jgi:hypothetical protein
MKRLITSALAAAVVAAAATTGAFAQSKPMPTQVAPDIHIQQCFVTTPKAMSKKASGTQIVYTNVGHHTLTSVTFAVGYRNSDNTFLRKVTDEGEFAPGATINHHFSLYNDVTFGGKATRSCTAIAAK